MHIICRFFSTLGIFLVHNSSVKPLLLIVYSDDRRVTEIGLLSGGLSERDRLSVHWHLRNVLFHPQNAGFSRRNVLYRWKMDCSAFNHRNFLMKDFIYNFNQFFSS